MSKLTYSQQLIYLKNILSKKVAHAGGFTSEGGTSIDLDLEDKKYLTNTGSIPYVTFGMFSSVSSQNFSNETLLSSRSDVDVNEIIDLFFLLIFYMYIGKKEKKKYLNDDLWKFMGFGLCMPIVTGVSRKISQIKNDDFKQYANDILPMTSESSDSECKEELQIFSDRFDNIMKIIGGFDSVTDKFKKVVEELE